MKKLKKWWNKGRNERVPNEDKASWKELIDDDRKQLTRTDKSFKSGEKGIKGWRPHKAFSPKMVKTGPTPAVRQAFERPVRAVKNLLKKEEVKSMKTFSQFLEECYELEESSSGERSGRRTRGKVTLARGRGADMTRQERSTAAVAKKAGMRGTGKYSTTDLRTKPKHYTNYETDYHGDIGSAEQDHTIITHSSPRKAAQDERIISKRKDAGRDSSGWRKYKTAPSSDSVRRLKDFKKQISKSGADKRGRVHSVEINQRDIMNDKGDKKKLISRGKNFFKALKDTPNQLKKAGAKKGEAVIGIPAAVMSGEDEKTGQAKRAKLYKKIFGKRSTKKSEKTGMMVGSMNK